MLNTEICHTSIISFLVSDASTLTDQVFVGNVVGMLGNSYLEHHRRATEQVDELEAAKRERLGKMKIIEGFIHDIENRPLALAEFDEKLWLAVIDRVTVGRDGVMLFRFKNGTEITV